MRKLIISYLAAMWGTSLLGTVAILGAFSGPPLGLLAFPLLPAIPFAALVFYAFGPAAHHLPGGIILAVLFTSAWILCLSSFCRITSVSPAAVGVAAGVLHGLAGVRCLYLLLISL